ncbi:MAG: toxin-antitoxin system YwqK family antitoxin [Bacteroidota bacterium]
MFRIFIFILSTIFSFSVFGQDTLNRTDINGLKQGFWCKRDSAGRTIYEGRFKNGIPAGEFRYYYPNGKVKTVSILSDYGKRAFTISYFPNGQKMAAGNYLNEKKDSTWLFFSESNGSLVSEEQYCSGLIDGVSKVFNPEGGLSEVHYYKKGVRDGLWEQYYLDGKIKLRATYKAGEKHGLFQTFYNSGQLMFEGGYKFGHQDGTWIYYNEDGSISKKEIYEIGRFD